MRKKSHVLEKVESGENEYERAVISFIETQDQIPVIWYGNLSIYKIGNIVKHVNSMDSA